MKKYFFLAAALAMGMTACSDEDFVEEPSVPIQQGDAILFGAGLDNSQNGADSRTVYGDRTATGIPVHWVKGDQVAIYSPQASQPASKLVSYSVTPDPQKPNCALSVTKTDMNGAGLQWGQAPIHDFYAVYPNSVVTNANPNGFITATLPVTQNPVSWRTRQEGTGTVYMGQPDMNFAVMTARKTVLKDTLSATKPIGLQFKNLVTVLDITIPGPKTGSVTISQVNVEAVKGNLSLVGDFTIDMSNVSDQIPSCQPVATNKVNNKITISCYNQQKGNFITLKPGDALNVKAYLIPDSDAPVQARELKVSVSSINSGAVKSKILHNLVVMPHKINRIRLPHADGSGEPAHWMSDLDPNIYLTELSIPGSKMAYLTSANGASPAYQTKTIEGQFKDGVRAFIVQTGADRNWWNGNITIPVFGASNGTTLETTLQSLSNAIKAMPADKTDCAVLVLTAEYSIVSGFSGDGQIAWIREISARIKSLIANGNKYGIYDQEVTPETTLGDVARKIVIKVNYNSDNQLSEIAKNVNVPALFSKWIKPSATDWAPTSPLFWSNNSKQNMKWMCQEATNVGDGAEISVAGKKEAIQTLFTRGLNDYINPNSKHDTWYMNDLGGVYKATSSTTDLARDMNQVGIDALQSRKQNASTGLVFMNFADRDANSGKLYKSDWLLQTIIDNNSKFALRKKPGSANPAPQQSTNGNQYPNGGDIVQ